jgi:hypothetical protein
MAGAELLSFGTSESTHRTSMAHPLEQRVDEVRRTAARLQRWIALFRVLATLIAGFLALAIFDWFSRSHLPVVRWALCGLLVGVLVAAIWRWIVPAARSSWSQIAMARRIEQRFPELSSRLSSSIAFAGNVGEDPTAGSLALRRAVIAETDAIALPLNFVDVLDRRPFRRAASVLAAAVASLGILIVLFPHSSVIAARRLATPWVSTNWPHQTLLAIVNGPTILARGADWNVEVVDRSGRMPDRVQLLIRFEGQTRNGLETFEMKPLDHRMVYRLDHVTQPFSYRAVGGDDSAMPWTHVEIVEPPKIVDLEFTARPPAYAAQPEQRLEGVSRVLEGSQLSLRGSLDKRATKVRLQSEGKTPVVLTAVLGSDGKSFAIPGGTSDVWLAEKSETYKFDILDDSGIAGGAETRIELQVVPDSPPAIAWELPTDQTFVTPRALVPIKALVKDDLAIERVDLKYLRPDATDSDEQVVSLYLAERKLATATTTGTARTIEGQSVAIDSNWDLISLGLRPGDVLAIHLEAVDFKPRAANTTVRRISVIDDAEFQNRLLQQQTSVFTQLAEVLRLQREAHGQVTALQVRIDETNRLQPRDIDQLQGAELMQRQVQRLIDDPADGIDARLTAILVELGNNRIENEAISRRMNELRAQLRHVSSKVMVDIGQQLTSALKSGRALDLSNEVYKSEQKLAPVTEPLLAAEAKQQQAIAELEALLGELSEWDTFSRLAREVGQIRQLQEELLEETESLRWKIAAAAGEQPTPEQRAGARQLAAKQQELGRRFDKLQARMDELHNRLQSSDPRTAEVLGEANELGRRLAIGGQMRQSGRELTEYRVGAGQQVQQAVATSLGELLDAFSNRRERDLQRTVASLRAARDQLDLMRQQQKQLASLAEEAANDADEAEQKRRLMRLAKEQQELAKEADELKRKLERLQAKRPAAAAGQGAESMSGASQAAEAGNAEQAQSRAEEASRLLDEARDQLQQEIEQAQADLLREELTRLEQSIEGLTARQRNVVVEVRRLEGARGADGSLPKPQQVSLQSVAAEQELLAEEVVHLRANLGDAAAFALALEGVHREMTRTASLLNRGQTDQAAVQSAEVALKRLEQILLVLKEDKPSDEPAPAEGSEGGGENQPQGESAIHSLAELRLLAQLQGEINRRTLEIEAERQKAGRLTPDQDDELMSLAAEQGKLADMVAEMANRSATQTEGLPQLPPRLDDTKPTEQADPNKSPSLDDELLRDLLEKP